MAYSLHKGVNIDGTLISLNLVVESALALKITEEGASALMRYLELIVVRQPKSLCASPSNLSPDAKAWGLGQELDFLERGGAVRRGCNYNPAEGRILKTGHPVPDFLCFLVECILWVAGADTIDGIS